MPSKKSSKKGTYKASQKGRHSSDEYEDFEDVVQGTSHGSQTVYAVADGRTHGWDAYKVYKGNIVAGGQKGHTSVRWDDGSMTEMPNTQLKSTTIRGTRGEELRLNQEMLRLAYSQQQGIDNPETLCLILRMAMEQIRPSPSVHEGVTALRGIGDHTWSTTPTYHAPTMTPSVLDGAEALAGMHMGRQQAASAASSLVANALADDAEMGPDDDDNREYGADDGYESSPFTDDETIGGRRNRRTRKQRKTKIRGRKSRRR